MTIDRMPTLECESCGTFYIGTAHECPENEKPEGIPHGAPGHRPAITPMRAGGYRAECSCGGYRDTASRYLASRYLVWHIRAVKEEANERATKPVR